MDPNGSSWIGMEPVEAWNTQGGWLMVAHGLTGSLVCHLPVFPAWSCGLVQEFSNRFL